MPVSESESPRKHYKPQANLPRPLSLQKGLRQEDTESEGFCEMLRKHQENKVTSVKRINRRNIPSAQQPRSKLDDLMDQCSNEEVMRVKNQNAIHRAMQNDNTKPQYVGAYKPSINALKPSDARDYKSAGHENQPPVSARRNGHKSSIA